MNEEGKLVREARRARRLSQEGLSRLLAVSAGREPHDGPGRNQVYRWEKNKRQLEMWRPHVERVLGIDLPDGRGDSVADLPSPSSPLVHVEGGLAMALDRRMLLADSGGLAIAAVTSVPPVPRNVAPGIVNYFRKELEQHWRTNSVVGPEHLLSTVTMQARVIGGLAAAAEGGLRRQMWQMASAFAGLITWLWQDAGSLDRASMWGSLAVDLAHRANDAQLISHALTNEAMVGMDQGDGHACVELASAALANEGKLCAKVRVQAMQQAAHGHAMTGDRDACDQLLDRAQPLIDKMDDDFPWGNAPRTPLYLEIQRASCYTRLGMGDEAVRLWDQVMPLVSRQSSGVFNARRAGALDE